MSRVSALAHLEAMQEMQAVPLTLYRHRHLSDRPLVVVPLMMAGEAGSPLAAMVGTAKTAPTLLVIGQPRNRDQRFAFVAELGEIVLAYIDSCRRDRRPIPVRTREPRSAYGVAPQVLVPNPGGVRALGELGRMCRFRSSDGPFPVPAAVPRLGRWLTFLLDTAEQAGTSMLLPVTDLLAEHWATGQSPLEDQNLALIMAWIDPPDGLSVAEAMSDAENPVVCPPAGPATSPEFDNTYLAPAIRRFDAARTAGDAENVAAAQNDLRELLGDQIKPTWRMTWRAISLLRGIPEAPRAAQRLARDRKSFTARSDREDSGEVLPQPKRDNAITAAQRLSRLEQAIADFEADKAFDDPYVLAGQRNLGEAFCGVVVAADPDRIVMSGSGRRIRRPHVTVRTLDPTRLGDHVKLISPSMPPPHKVVIVSSVRDGDASLVTVEVTGGMGTVRAPRPDGVPIVGQQLAYLPDPGWRQAPTFPDLDHLPWTHTAQVHDDDEQGKHHTDAAEEWGDER